MTMQGLMQDWPLTVDRIIDHAAAADIVQTSTDATGGFCLEALRPGAYELRTQRIGYRQHRRPVQMRPDAIDTLRIQLPQHRVTPCDDYFLPLPPTDRRPPRR
jgi:carboxypeptidase family protein